ncbi:MAG: hypothetical protein ACRER5_04425, partial [Pseudomonas sp.]
DHQSDLSVVDELPLGGARLLTASALFDLASAPLLEQLVARLPTGCAIYAALNYDGDIRWTPRHPLDERVAAAFNQDQRRDKGLGGPALGPQAVTFLAPLLESEGFHVEVAESPWRLDGQQSPLVQELVRGIAAAVSGSLAAADTADEPAENLTEALTAAALADWRVFREQHADSGTCYIGHLDLLATPSTSAGERLDKA